MATPDTLTTDPVKKPPAALPLAGGTPTASSTLSTPSNPTATAQPALPLAPVTPSGPATTSDPMAFAPNAGGTPAIAGDPGAAAVAPSYATQATPWAANMGQASNPNGYGWSDGSGGAGFTPPLTELTPEATVQQSADAAKQAASTGSTNSGWGAPGFSYGGSAGQYDGGPSYVKPTDKGYVPTTAPDATTSGRHLSPGPANDVNGSAPASNPLATVGMGTPGTPSTPSSTTPGLNGLPNVGPTATTANGTVGTTPTDPNNPLTLQTLSVGPTADRFKLAQDQWNQFQKATDPAYQATLRSQDAHDFGAGRGVSGAHKNSIGDIATQRATALDTQRQSFLDNALENSIGDAYRNVGIAQQQQGYQSGQQQTGFNQAVELQRLADSENAQSFGQALQQANLGFQGSPADFLKWIAGQYARAGA